MKLHENDDDVPTNNKGFSRKTVERMEMFYIFCSTFKIKYFGCR
jgi:hypothetical protein